MISHGNDGQDCFMRPREVDACRPRGFWAQSPISTAALELPQLGCIAFRDFRPSNSTIVGGEQLEDVPVRGVAIMNPSERA